MKKYTGLTPEQLARAKCTDSPTGAHHWMIGRNGYGTCKYCLETRRFRTGWQDSRFTSLTRRPR